MNNLEFRDIIIKHYQNPLNYGFLKTKKDIKIRHNSQYCIDDITLQLIIENKKVISAKFEGQACTIATSATDLFCSKITNQNISKIKIIVNKFAKMINNQNNKKNDSLGNLGWYGLVSQEPKRSRCALIPAELITKGILNT